MDIKLNVLPETTREFFKDVRVPPIRSTPLATLDECPRKFLYQAKLGLRAKTLERPLSVGTFVHLTLAGLFMGKSEEEALAYSEAALEKNESDLMGWADPAGFLPDGSDLKSTLQGLHEDYYKARAMALVFWRFRPFDASKWEVLLDPDGQPMVERHLDHELPTLGMSEDPKHPLPFPVVRTTCDLALVKKETGEVWIVDFKTTSFDARKRSESTGFSPQLALYRLGLQMELDKWAAKAVDKCASPATFVAPRVVGSFHAIIQKPTIKYCPHSKDKRGFQAYVARLVQWYKDKEEADPNHPPLLLDSTLFPNALMTQELWGRLERYVDAAGHDFDLDYFYRAGESACFKFNRVCPFMALCNSTPALWPEIVRNRFVVSFREDEEKEEV